MTYPDSNNVDPHKLQIEFAGGGPGSIIRTAVGAGSEGGPVLDPAYLRDPPWWPFLFQRKAASNFEERFTNLDLTETLTELEALAVPPVPRLAFCLGKGLIDPVRDGFGRGDLKELMFGAGLGGDPVMLARAETHGNSPEIVESLFERELARIEGQIVYQMWRKDRAGNSLTTSSP